MICDWAKKFQSPPPLGANNHTTSSLLIICLLGSYLRVSLEIPLISLLCSHLNICVARSAEADAVLLVNVGGLEVAESLPGDGVALLLVEPDLDVVLVDLVAEQEDLLSPIHRSGSLCQSTYGEVAFGLWNRNNRELNISSPRSICQNERKDFAKILSGTRTSVPFPPACFCLLE